jgi:predicted DNA-binding transcriptional regulator AlpA
MTASFYLETAMTKLLVTYKELRELGIPYSRTHLARLIAVGEFPRPIKLGTSRVAFKLAEILEWIESRIAWTSAIDMPSE